MSQIQFGSRIQSLASGGYVGIINKHLQVLDSSLKTLNDRILDLPKEQGWVYDLITPLSGPFFILELARVYHPQRASYAHAQY
jgi:hypothetical protein